MPSQGTIRRLTISSLVFTDNFKGWIKHQVGGDPHPVMNSIRDDFPNHFIVTPPFEFQYRDANYVVQIPTYPALFMFVALKTSGQAKVIGARFYTAPSLVRSQGFKPAKAEVVVPTGDTERQKILRYLLVQSEKSEVEEDRELIDRLIQDIRGLKHLTEDADGD